ncbi:MAG: type II CAAX endopeptidase family protein [Sphingomonadaceae bacterium]|nr:CPBP family intramembrane metalloprotease [Sphingomonadaceae bacterium]
MNTLSQDFAPKPLWRTIWDFPLVAMLVSLAVFTLALGLISLGLTAAPLGLDEKSGPLVMAVVASLAVILLVKLLVSRLGDNPRDDLPWTGAIRPLLIGIGGSALLMTIIVAFTALLGGYVITGWGGASSWLWLLLMAGLQAAVVEEFLFRGVLFRFLEEFGGSWFALALTSALFGYVHISNDNATWVGSLGIALEAGIMLGAAYMVSRSLWLPIGIHFGWNVTQGLVWDVPVSGHDIDGIVEAKAVGPELVSGGAFGLEASVVAMVIAFLVGGYLTWLAWQRGQFMRPWWTRRRMARQMREGTPG